MPQKSSLNTETLRNLHSERKFVGEPANAILSAPDNLISYTLSLLKETSPKPGDISTELWSEWIRLLDEHAVLPLMYWKIGHLSPQLRPPEPVVDEIREIYLASRARNLAIEKQLDEITEAFQRKSIPLLVLKGPSLAWSLYPNPATRPFGDIDLLVSPDDFLQSRGILEEFGYRCPRPRFESARHFDCEEHFVHVQKGKKYCGVDLHWNLNKFPGIRRNETSEAMFDRSIVVKASSPTFRTLHPVDALMYSALHLIINHTTSMRLIWIYDILVYTRSLDTAEHWKRLQERSKNWHALLPVKYALEIAQAWTGLTLPEGFNDFSTWPMPHKEERRIWPHLMNRHQRITSRCKLFWPRCLSVFGKIKFFINALFPPVDFIRKCHPPIHDWLLPFSYVRRWCKWIY